MDRSGAQSTVNETKAPIRVVPRILSAILYALGGFLSGACALPFGAYPFGIALLCAANRNALFVFLGLIGSSVYLFDGSYAAIFIGIYSALLLLRILVRLTVDAEHPRADGKKTIGELASSFFSEHIGYRVCASVIAAFALSLSFLIGGGFLYYDLFGLMLSSAVAPLATYVIYGFFIPEARDRAAVYRRDLGFAALSAVCVYAAAPIGIYGVSLAVAGGMLLVLCTSRSRGFVSGLLLSIAVGLAYSPTMSPIFVVCALSFGVFSKISTTLIYVSSLFSALGYAFYVEGIHALNGTVGGIVTAVLLFAITVRLTSAEPETVNDKPKSALRCRVLDENELDSVRLFDMNRRMAAMSEGFSSLSDLFEEMKVKFPRRAELEDICEQAFETSCVGCAEYARCRSNGYIRKQAQRLSSALDSRGAVLTGDFDPEISSRCGRLPDIIDEINYNFDIRFRRSDSRENESEIFWTDRNCGYKALSRMLEKSMESSSDEYIPDLSASAMLCEDLDALDVGISGVIVYGAGRKRVYIKGTDKRMLESACEQICELVEKRLSVKLDSNSIRIRRSGREQEGSIELREALHFSVSCVTQSSAAGDESICGDSLVLFENSDGRFFAAISDGMGSGRDAALMSELAAGFIRNMLSSGSMNLEILNMLNSFLQMGYDSSACECSATLDLMEFDEVSGQATFFKCGAAPTYVYRNGNLFKLRSRTMPLGILPETDARVLDFDLNDGDVVVMISDGVTGGKEECPYLFDLLRQNIDSAGCSRTADLIMKYAKGNGSDDDITVAVMRVKKAEK